MFPDLLRDDVFRLETDRLWLRWPRASDAARVAELAGDKDVAEMTARIPHPYPPGAAAEFVLTTRAGNLSGKQLVLVLAAKQRPNEAIGCAGLHAAEPREAMLGYWLGRPHWGKGLASEAARALTGLAMRVADMDAVVASARPDNLASRRVLEKIGFTRSGFGVEPAPARGGTVAVEKFRLTREAWSGRKQVAPTKLALAAN